MKFNLEDRLIKFSVDVIHFCEKLPESNANTHLSGQLIRSATAPPLIYAEANSAESTADFVHKMGLALKELRETCCCLKIFKLKGSIGDVTTLDPLLDENNQLIAFFGASINTARKKLKY